MHTIHDHIKIVVNPHNSKVHHPLHTSSNKSYIGHLAEFKCHAGHAQSNLVAADTRVALVTRVVPSTL
jgi:hypothetical protein